MEIYYRAIAFYMEEQPMQLNAMLNTIAPKVDHTHVVQQVKKACHLPLIVPFLKHIQHHNVAAVNDAVRGALRNVRATPVGRGLHQSWRMNNLFVSEVNGKTRGVITLRNGKPALTLYGERTHLHINPSGRFSNSGPQGSDGLTSGGNHP